METEKQRGAVVCIGRGGGGAGASGARVPTASLALKPRIDAIATGAKQSAEAEADSFGWRIEVERVFTAAFAVAAEGERGDVGEGLLQAEGPSTCRVTTLKGCGLDPREEPSPAMAAAAGGGIGFALLAAPLVF